MGKKAMDLAIYGAQAIALGAYTAIHHLYPARRIRCFLVTSRAGNPECLAGIPVYELGMFSGMVPCGEKGDMEILIATPESVMGEIERALEELGFYCHVRLDSGRWAQIMGYYYACGKDFPPLPSMPVGFHKADLRVYMAKFYKDKPLVGEYFIPEWMTAIQVGAALCSERVADVLDCEGDNISKKNGNYSELTGLYWIWKHGMAGGQDCYYGLNHYRRVFLLDEDDLLRLVDNGLDAILPYPMPYEPNIEAHHKRYLKEGDWDALLQALRELQPEYAKAFPKILRQRYLYNYNIIVARWQVLAEYCSWLFPILERVEQLSVPQGNERSDRYIGYMGETLETLYFMHNKARLTIAHTGCKFLI